MRFEKKLNKILWFIIALIPLLLVCLYMFNQSSNVGITVFITDFIGLFGQGFIYEYLLEFMQIFAIDGILYTLLCCYINYLIIVCLIKLVYNLLLFLVNLCNSMFERIGGAKYE